jgi:hypothetical protein
MALLICIESIDLDDVPIDSPQGSEGEMGGAGVSQQYGSPYSDGEQLF